MKDTKRKSDISAECNYLVGRRIREARVVRNIKQEYMAEKLNISTAHYSNIENGHRSCTLQKLIQTCCILDVSSGELLCDCIRADKRKGELNMHELIQQLSPNDKRRLEAVVMSYCTALD